MDDAVASVLAERSRLDRGLTSGIATSLVIHGMVTAAAVFAALRHPQVPVVPAVNIRFAPIPRSMAPAAAPPRATAPPAPAAIPAKTPSVPSDLSPTPAAPPAKAVKGAPPSPFGRSLKKPAAQAATAAPATASTAAPAGIDIPIGSSGVTGLEGGDFPYTVYIDRMRNLIGTHWFRPQGGTSTTTVYFVIDRDGTLRDARNETSSGNSAFDRAALRAILESSPLPPLPFGYNGTFLGVHLTFR